MGSRQRRSILQGLDQNRTRLCADTGHSRTRRRPATASGQGRADIDQTWATNSMFERCFLPVMPSATFVDRRLSIPPSSMKDKAEGISCRNSKKCYLRQPGRGQAVRMRAEPALAEYSPRAGVTPLAMAIATDNGSATTATVRA